MKLKIHKWLFSDLYDICLVVAIILKFILRLRFPSDVSIKE